MKNENQGDPYFSAPLTIPGMNGEYERDIFSIPVPSYVDQMNAIDVDAAPIDDLLAEFSRVLTDEITQEAPRAK